jgi:hypothetical protein
MSYIKETKRFLAEVDFRAVKRVVIFAEDEGDAMGRLMTTDVELFMSDSGHEDLLNGYGIEVLGDEPAGHGSGGVQVLGEVDERKTSETNTIVVLND